ncbi:hypothetical protein JD844_028188 [Phrynosoma platyrhinos]|uniref:STRA8 bHLH domain-containing protein n=1 Tax=Phrynosoma platyrhinos TaxID=52577 RepID=A0ABQ7SHG4_PHRPL|nr:hypothetical protein JD844_028188 [Phrynosoma platyrhinos]
MYWNGIVLQFLMETTGKCNTPYVRVTPRNRPRLQDPQPQVRKRRLTQARQRATLAGLFNSLRETVYAQQENSVSESQVLCKAKNYIQELEQTLENLLRMKAEVNQAVRVQLVENFNLKMPFAEENQHIREELSTQPPGLSEERRDSVLQYCSQRQNFISEVKTASQEPACTEGSVRDSGTNSQEASGSVVSTPEEILFEDAFDVATSFLDSNETQEMSSQSSAFTGCISESQEDNHHLYLQIISFLKSLFFASTQTPQEEVLQLDYETVMLRCTETFDDEDL